MGEDSTEVQNGVGPEPKSPSHEDETPRSKIYSEKKLRNDYELFLGDKPGFNKDRPLGEVQKELFNHAEVEDENQAFEWLLARKWDEFDSEDRNVLKQHATDKGKRKYGHIWKL